MNYPVRDARGRFRSSENPAQPRPLHLRNGGKMIRQTDSLFRREVNTPAPVTRTGEEVLASMMEENPYGGKNKARWRHEDRRLPAGPVTVTYA